MSRVITKFYVPPTTKMGSYSGVCRANLMETKAQNALSDYNSAMKHDGLKPLKRMPNGTKYSRVVIGA